VGVGREGENPRLRLLGMTFIGTNIGVNATGTNSEKFSTTV
jgi:hypothetical protein